MKINLRVRKNNPMFWFQLFLSVAVPIGAYFGITGQDITSWSILGRLLVDAISNPYVLFTVLVSVYNALLDPTVRGINDSERSLRYKQPMPSAKKVK